MPWKNEPELRASGNDEESPPESIRLDVEQSERDYDPARISVSAIDASLKELIIEIKRKRRWGTALKLTSWLVFLIVVIAIFTMQNKQIVGKHSALVRLEGIIADGYDASAENVLAGLKSAFKEDNVKGIILAINSPGGSPVQADMLYREIQRLKTEYNKPLFAVISDVGASGGYYVAVAADKIYANPSSIVGSIGVLMNSFGFVGLMEKIGVERRLLTAGEHKGALDEFLPVNENELAHVKTVLDGVHRQFISVVRDSRGSRLKETDKTYSGLFWNGEQAYEMGLTDGFKSYWSVARDDIGQENIIDYTVRPDIFERFTRNLGVVIADRFKMTIGNFIPRMH